MQDFKLLVPSSELWLNAVLSNFDTFLNDHAGNEKKASAMAMSMVSHYPDRRLLVAEMIDLAIEELGHFRQVVALLNERQLQLTPDEQDPYINQLRKYTRAGTADYFLDRLLLASVVEARGKERFELLAAALHEETDVRFYRQLAKSETKHYQLFLRLANHYFPAQQVADRLQDWLETEASILQALTIRPALH